MSAKSILALHRVVLEELRLPYFSPSMNDLRMWEDFLRELKALEETPGGPLCPADVRAVLRGMWKANVAGQARYAMRLTSIMREPERFRDLVLESRRVFRKPRPATREVSKTVAGITRSVELSAVVDASDASVEERRFLEQLTARRQRRNMPSKP